ncbi:rRNA maturation RNase YbeY [Aequorivita sp. F47161]|uniref:Endoribonuclease YbeY n=1 Tax=Aequorivita vitellina TaxID=2874475 RepID=A0A9X1QRN4_9FLAO|nr:rRNA maturation RNase YbeY [Aequorivita vitellina]MCG2417505.1 rRNA maturation RNase YbeY [Aequorivita vitellina]MCZ4318235.1 rRNA maturation RNase YbeY [Aequorivita viscosa]
MIEFNFETDFSLENTPKIINWITDVIISEGCELGEILYVFCDDEYLHKLNIEFLNHDTLTDILSFDYGLGKQINGEIFISVERVADNATDFKTSFTEELHRVMIHGILHFCGYKDKTESEETQMRKKENAALRLLSSI